MRPTATLPKCTARIRTFWSLMKPHCGRKVRKVPSKDHSKSPCKSETHPPDRYFFKKINKFFKRFNKKFKTYTDIYGFCLITSFFIDYLFEI